MIKRLIIVATCLVMAACSAPEQDAQPTIDSIAEGYVKLVLRVGLYDKDVVDAYYGPKEWRPEPVVDGAEMPPIATTIRASTPRNACN